MATSWRGQQGPQLGTTDAERCYTESPDCFQDRRRKLSDLTWLPPRVGQSLLTLLEAHRYAIDLDVDPWGFCTRLSSLRQQGLNDTDVLWLVKAQLVEFAYDISLPGELTRQFRRSENLLFADSLCFVLTASGVEFTEAWLRCRQAVSPTPQVTFLESAAAAAASERTPRWDRDRQELSVGDAIVKRFKAPAANQETILAAFEEEDWPPRIDDPLSPSPEVEPKRRLHDTINSLNRNQKMQLLRFFGDGSGTGIRWEFMEESRDSGSANTLSPDPTKIPPPTRL